MGYVRVAVLLLLGILIATVAVALAECPEGCSCLTKEEAEKLGCKFCDKEIQCGKGSYCFKCECPDGCVCLDKDTAAKYDLEKLCGGEKRVCSETSAGLKYCWQGYECPESCACLTEKEAKEKGLEFCNGKMTVCGESDGSLKFCFAEKTTKCPEGCECLTEEKAKELGYVEKCSEEVCGYESITVTTAPTPKYCWKTVQTCPEGCECLIPQDAESRGYKLCNNQEIYCGEEYGYKKYCYQQTATCPSDCKCMTEADAENTFYCPLKCSEEVCGYESTTVTTATTSPTPKYCYKEGCVPICPVNCRCLSEEEAKETFKCPEKCSDRSCGTKLENGKEIPLYCYKETCNVTVTVLCSAGCECMTEEKAKELGYNVRCSDKQCGDVYDNVIEYCYKKVYQCPENCACLSDEEVKKYEESGVKLERCSDEQCGDGKYCYRKVEFACPEGCVCLSKDEGLKGNYEFCKDANGNLIRCAIIDEEHGEYKYCFKRTVEKCHFDEERQVCTGYCENARCTMSEDYILCQEECKKKFEDCISTTSTTSQEEGCKEAYEKCISACKPSCKCTSYTCPENCACLSDEEVKKYEESGVKLERCSDEQCGDGKYCYRTATKCYFDYDKQQCVGSCEVGTCQLNTIKRDPETNKIIYAECHCKPIGVCSDGCECLTREDASEKFNNPVLCNNQPCGIEIAGLTTANTYINKYCFREGMEVCHYDREKQQCVGGCEKGECRMFEDNYGEPFCKCVSKTKAVSQTVVERVLPDTAQPLTCIPVTLIVKPEQGLKKLSIVETYPAEFEFRGASVSSFNYISGILFLTLEDDNGLSVQNIWYKLCLPRDAMGEYYFRGIWESGNITREVTGDSVLKVVPQLTNWPPCPVTDKMLVDFVDQWSKGELSDLQLLQVVEIWNKGCGG